MDEVAHGPEAVPLMEDRILPWSQVKVISGLSRTTVWRLQKTGDFPMPVQVSVNRVGWRQSEVLEWRRTRLPRRLPDPKVAPVKAAKTPEPEAKAADVRAEASLRPSVEDVEASCARVRPRRRRRTECEHQTAFDFGV